ncbi:MAG: hypothetical protein K2X69_09165 [Silvanigrellaceae bacterium]|nr:hypothetical protein [Silvanigrellaceae bacterium]
MARRASTRKNELFSALDLMMSGGIGGVIGSDFIMTHSDPYNADIGHLDPSDLRNYDDDFIDKLVELAPKNKLKISGFLNVLSKDYLEQRRQFGKYQDSILELVMNEDIAAAKELGNYDTYISKVVLRNDAEINTFFDYIALHREINGMRAISSWNRENPAIVDKTNKIILEAYEQAQFAVLHLEENLDHGVIQAINVITKKRIILIDNALHRHNKKGCFFICSLLNLGEYFMTSGAGTTIDPNCSAGKSALTLLKKHLVKIRKAKEAFDPDVRECVREIYGFILRAGLLRNHSVG